MIKFDEFDEGQEIFLTMDIPLDMLLSQLQNTLFHTEYQ